MSARHVRTSDPYFGPERFDMRDFFLRHFVGNHQQHAVTFRARDQRKAQTGVACRGFNHRAPGPQFPFVLCRFDHRERNPVLDRAAWILILKFEKKLTWTGLQLRNLHEGRVAD